MKLDPHFRCGYVLEISGYDQPEDHVAAGHDPTRTGVPVEDRALKSDLVQQTAEERTEGHSQNLSDH